MNKENHTKTLEISKDYCVLLENGTMLGVSISANMINLNKDDMQDACSSMAQFARNFYLYMGNEINNADNIQENDTVPADNKHAGHILYVVTDESGREVEITFPENTERLTISGSPKEIAALMSELQERQCVTGLTAIQEAISSHLAELSSKKRLSNSSCE